MESKASLFVRDTNMYVPLKSKKKKKSACAKCLFMK